MRQITFALFISLILISGPFPAWAGKPTPPYPDPVQSEAYPPPEPGLSAPTLPDDFCEMWGRLCAWGYFGRWIATLQGLGPQYDLQIIICVQQIGTYYSACRQMQHIQYNVTTDTNTWAANPIKGECLQYPTAGLFYIGYVYSADLGFAEVRQPNEYAIYCDVLPIIHKEA